jgi:F420-dependent oxidoreductase-like protein
MTISHSPAARHPLTFGVVTGQHQLTWAQLREQWQMAEALGFDSIWLFDHFLTLYGDPDGPCLEASTLLAAMALATARVRIGVLVYGNTHRNPAILAKEVVTVDHLSGGRAILGIGAAWNEREHRAYGIPFPSPGDRVAMLDEALTVIRSLFTERRTTFHGRFYQLEDAPFAPKPVQAHLPVLVGGKRPKMLQVIARHADLWDSSGTPDEVRRGFAEIAAHCHALGRDPNEIGISVSLGADRLADEQGFADLVRAYYAAGARQFLFDFPLGGEELAAAERVAQTIIPTLREELA